MDGEKAFHSIQDPFLNFKVQYQGSPWEAGGPDGAFMRRQQRSVKGTVVLNQGWASNHLRVDRALFKNVRAWAPEILNSVDWGPNHVFRWLSRLFSSSSVTENHYTTNYQCYFSAFFWRVKPLQQEKEEKCLINTMKEQNKIVSICYWCHCLPRKSKGTNSIY